MTHIQNSPNIFEGSSDLPGRVFWITGLSGSGKSTIAWHLVQQLRQSRNNVVFLDGDVLRAILANDSGHSLDDRLRLAFCYARLCQELALQGHWVVCATMSLFADIWSWNRENIAYYHEIYLRVPLSTLVQRDSKGIYSRARDGKLKNVLGMDLPFQEPPSPHMVLDNDGSVPPQQLAALIHHTFAETRSIQIHGPIHHWKESP
ncbi:MAG: adenylyl-sulfate kinase [Magnetococcales bacterium]|nr:adenylyl-sulfate kinase [Magnetococcales bacterium]HIJ82939.1 adenylyl-sulfate kinase [Magnetococcales bacterium]